MASKAFLQQAYLAYFGRPADPSGLAYYAEASEAAVKAAFSASPESQAFFGSMEVVAKINAIYQNLFNRDAEPAGLTYWSQEIGSGRLSLADAAMGILAGAQNDDKTAVANKLAASEAFTAALDTTAEILGYAGAAAIAPARAYLQSVDATAASLTAATAGVATSVSSVVAAGTSNLNVGQTFALTAGIDNIVGTAGNDTINAYASSVTTAGANATTLGANDVVDGGAGVDTLNIEVLSAAADGTTARNVTIQGTIKNVEKVFITNGANLADATLDVTKLGAQLQEAWQVTSAKDVSGVTTQAVGFKNVADAAGANVAVAYGATTKSGTIALDNSGKSGLTVDVQGAALETLNVAGTVKAASAAAAGTLNLADDANGGVVAGTDGSVKILNLNLSTAAIVSVAGLDKLTTIASTGTGGLNLGATLTNKVKTVTTGAGDDTLTLATATDATTNASVSTGAGKDTITVSTTGTAGTVTIDAGAGDDGVVFTRALNVRDKVDGGDGKDSLTVVGTALIAEDYEVLKAVVSNVETLKFSQAMAGADASKLAQFGGFSFTTTNSSITKVADAQTLAVAIAAGGSLAATAAGYIAKGTGTPAATATTYAGTLSVEASGGTRIDGNDADAVVNYGPNDTVVPTLVNAKANAINLTVKATAATAAAAGVESNVDLTGDVTTATVNLVNSVNAATTGTATGDAMAVFSMAPSATVDGGGAFTNLGGLTTLTVTGNGWALIDNTGANTALKTVDASGMTGVASYDATKTSGGLKMLANNAVAETITLGGGLDVIVTSSTYDKMDTITGLKLVASAASATTVDATKSDDISVAGVTTFAKTTVTGASLGLAFVDAAAKAGANLVFQYDGNTYIYVDAVGAGVLDNGDTAIKLTGLVDLDLLVSALNA